jgi:hypothetical protein
MHSINLIPRPITSHYFSYMTKILCTKYFLSQKPKAKIEGNAENKKKNEALTIKSYHPIYTIIYNIEKKERDESTKFHFTFDLVLEQKRKRKKENFFPFFFI